MKIFVTGLFYCLVVSSAAQAEAPKTAYSRKAPHGRGFATVLDFQGPDLASDDPILKRLGIDGQVNNNELVVHWITSLDGERIGVYAESTTGLQFIPSPVGDGFFFQGKSWDYYFFDGSTMHVDGPLVWGSSVWSATSPVDQVMPSDLPPFSRSTGWVDFLLYAYGTIAWGTGKFSDAAGGTIQMTMAGNHYCICYYKLPED